MRYLAILIACVACALPAQATVDPDIDQIGVYFDLNADEMCLEVDPYGQFSAYLIITNPSATEIAGISVALCAEGGAIQSGHFWYESWLGIDFYSESCHYMTMSFTEPIPTMGSNVPLVRVDYLFLGEPEVEFYVQPYAGAYYEDGLVEYIDASNNSYPLGISSGDPNLPVAVVNGDCDAVVSATGETLGAVKSLFR